MGRGPVRTCAACRARRPQGELIRTVRTQDGRVSVDVCGGAPGRGAYVCPESACIDGALDSNRLQRALRHDGALPDGLRGELNKAATSMKGI